MPLPGEASLLLDFPSVSIKLSGRRLLIAVAVAVVVVVGAVTAVVVIRSGPDSPEEAVEALMSAVADKDTDALRAALCPAARPKAVHPAPATLFIGAPTMVRVWDGPLKLDRWSIKEMSSGSGKDRHYFIGLDVTTVTPSGEKRPGVVYLVPFLHDGNGWYYCPTP